MGLFRRRRDSSGADRAVAIADFWAWWTDTGADEVGVELGGVAPGGPVPTLAERVHAVDPSLQWSVDPAGGDATTRRTLIVTAAGNADLRPLARRWLLAAPDHDGHDNRWSYSDVRPAVADPRRARVQIGAWDFDVARATAAPRVSGAAVHLSVHHPDFHHLDEGTRALAAYLLLEMVLGESDVEVWVGSVTVADLAPLDPVPLVGLRAVVRDLKDAFLDPEDGLPRWADLRGTSPDGAAVAASVRIPLRPGTAPQLDTYVAVAVPYADRAADGLPTAQSSAALSRLVSDVDRQLGGAGRVAAHQTRGGVQVLHVYVDSTTSAVARLEAAVLGWADGRVTLARPVVDPGWDSVAHLRG